MDIAPTRDNLCAIVTSHQPGPGFELHCEKLLRQFRRLVVVDDGSAPCPLPSPSPLRTTEGFRWLQHSSNRGLAAALNTGLDGAKALGCSWVVLFDQDTVPLPEMLDGLLDAWARCPGPRVVVGANYWNEHRDAPFLSLSSNAAPVERKTLITAGTLMPLALADEIGTFREDYFIDSVDHEYSLRARQHGWRLFITATVLCRQSIGGLHRKRPWSRLTSFDHAPLRKYYIARNTVYTARLYARREPAWALRQGWRLCGDLVSLLLFERDKSARLQAFVRGLADGITGRLGPRRTEAP
jgi:rhamnosyltransferase